MIKGAHWLGIEREQHDSASKGPRMTFLCACCGQSRKILGRRKVGGNWVCEFCVAKLKENVAEKV